HGQGGKSDHAYQILAALKTLLFQRNLEFATDSFRFAHGAIALNDAISPFHTVKDAQYWLDSPLCPSVATHPQRPPLFHGPVSVPHRDLDDAGWHKLVDLPSHQFSVAARLRWLFRPASGFFSLSICRCMGGPMEPASHPEGHADTLDARILCARGCR